MENKDNQQENTTPNEVQSHETEPKTQHVSRPSGAEKVQQNKKNRTKSMVTNLVVLGIIVF